MIISPLTIQVLIECVCSDKPGSNIPESVWRDPEAHYARSLLRCHGLIDGPDYHATARGKAWLSFICQTPLPVQEWVLPERKAQRGDERSVSKETGEK
ncbi:hypothetical protein [Hyphomicrobium sp.]|uniref:hypothetical protein n=1 Tax=Hyphomicrobium sp. TaxID=82 RepID=UPI002FDCED69